MKRLTKRLSKKMPKIKKKIAILGPIGISIPPKKQGGIEWMVYYLTEGLVKKGYKVLLFAPATTKTSAKLVPVCPRPISECKIPSEVELSRKLRVELSFLANLMVKVLERKNEIGLIFNHSVDGGMFTILEKSLKIPIFHVLHLPLYKELANVFKKFNSRLITISDNQRKVFPRLNYFATIYNGIDLKKIPFSKKPKGYFVFSGKIKPSKNPLDAIKAVKLCQKKLILIGKIGDQEYFELKIKPLLDKNIVYLGEVNYSKAIKFYSQAKALLSPIKWQEPFGLVMIEAMACGTPVIAFDRGSVREVIKDCKTGFIVKNTKEMTKAIKKIDQIDRKECRKWVEKKFSLEKMIDEYEKVYYEILKRAKK